MKDAIVFADTFKYIGGKVVQSVNQDNQLKRLKKKQDMGIYT